MRQLYRTLVTPGANRVRVLHAAFDTAVRRGDRMSERDVNIAPEQKEIYPDDQQENPSVVSLHCA